MHYLVKKDADVNCKDNNYQTPLHISCEKGFYNIVTFLQENGADLNVEDINDQWMNSKKHLFISQVRRDF